MNLLFEQLEIERLMVRVAKHGHGVIFNQSVKATLPGFTPGSSWVSQPPMLEQFKLTFSRAFARLLLNEDHLEISLPFLAGLVEI